MLASALTSGHVSTRIRCQTPADGAIVLGAITSVTTLSGNRRRVVIQAGRGPVTVTLNPTDTVDVL